MLEKDVRVQLKSSGFHQSQMSSPGFLTLPPGLEESLISGGLSLAAVPLPSVKREAHETTGFTFKAKKAWLPREHPLWEDGDIQRHIYHQEVLMGVTEVVERTKVSEFGCHVAGCSQFFNTLEGFEHHYNALHRNVCSFCKRSFPSGHLLDVHILEWHDSLFQILSQKQDMYQCLVEGCQHKFKTSRDRKEHLVKAHLYPSDFRFDKPKKDKSQGKLNRSPPQKDLVISMDVTPEESADSMDVCPPETVVDAPCIPSVSSGTALLYKNKIPSTICFGQGAVRGFKSSKKKK